MTLNGVMAVILSYFTEFDKHAFQHTHEFCFKTCVTMKFVDDDDDDDDDDNRADL